MMKRILLSAMATAGAFAALAQWNANPANGTLVSGGPTTLAKSDIVSVSDGAGGAFVAWIEAQSATASKIYIQRLTADGFRVFPTDAVVSESSGDVSAVKANLYMTTDSAGGVICVWQDYRFRTSTSSARDEIYGQRISPGGVRLWDTAGVRMSVGTVAASTKISPVAAMLNTTEAVVVFGDNRLGNSDLYAQKVNVASGAPLWTVSGTPDDISLHGNQAGTSTFQAVLPDGSGGAFVVWQDPRISNNIDVYGQRINNAGTIQWGTGGTAIASNTGNQTQPSATLDGAGGLVVAYSDFIITGGTDPSIYAQRVDGGGTKQWGSGGVAVGVAANVQSNPYVVRSGGNFVITWGDQRVGGTGSRDIYVQALNAAGALQWMPASMVATDGIPVVTAAGNQPSSSSQSGYQIVSDSTGGAVIVWDDARGAALDIYAQRINGGGAVQWTSNGVPVSTASSTQQTPVAVLSTGQRVIVAWRDGRTAANGEIFAARLQSNGVLPVRALTVNAAAKGASIDVQWNTIDESNTANFVVEKSADGVSFSAIGSAKAKGSGNGTYSLADLRPVRGINYYRIKAVDADKKHSYSNVVPVSFSGLPKAAMVFYPNPVRDNIVLQLSNLAKGSYQLFVRDFSGRTALQQTLKIESGYATLLVSVQSLSAGQYVIEVQGESEVMKSKLTKVQ